MPEAEASGGALPAHIRADPAPFLSRDEELELIRRLLVGGPARLLTLTGPAGVGKTRLAQEAAKRLEGDFPNGVGFVDLTALRDPVEVPAALAGSLGLPDAAPAPILERLSRCLQARETLLILDNFEQVLPAAAVLDALLQAAPRLRFLVTSREPLHLRMEQTLPVPPLALPDPAHLPALDGLAEVPSVALFLQRAQRIDPGFRLTDENARAVAELCVRLDGLPLAIELAAARTRLLSPQMLLERLDKRLSILHWEAQDLPLRQQTLRAAIAWSHDLLSAEDQVLFRRLGIFVGGFTLDAAEAIVADEASQSIDVVEGTASLVDKSLVLSEEDGEGAIRFRLLESVRDFALEQVTSCEEGDSVRRAHAMYFLGLAEQAAPELVGPNQRSWFLRLEREHDNLRVALRWLWSDGENDQALRLARALGYFWEVRGYLREGQQALEDALARVPDADRRMRAGVLNRLGSLLIWQRDAERAGVVIEEALALGRELGDPDILARSLSQLGRRAAISELSEERLGEAEQLLEEALALRWETRDVRGAANVQAQLAVIALRRRAYPSAEQLADAALAAYRQAGDDAGAAVPLVLLGLAAGELGDTARAAALMRQGLETSSRLQDRRLLVLVSKFLVWWLAGAQGDPEQLAILLGAAEAMGEVIGSAPLEWRSTGTPEAIAALQARLGKQAWEAALREGRAMSFSQISELVSVVLNGVAGDGQDAEEPGLARRRQAPLTKREEDVLRLVAEGLTNKEIARRLNLSENTVKTHVTSLFNRLGVDSRARAVAVAAREGLLTRLTG